MLHAFRLGPVVVGSRLFVYAAVEEDGDLVGPATAGSDAEGLRALLAAAEGRPIRCEPALAGAASRLGLGLADLPEPVLLARALLAFGISHSRDGALPLALHERFLEACAALWQAAPWKTFRSSDDALPAVLAQGALRFAREVSVLGGDGEGVGFVLYDAPGSTARVADAAERGRLDVIRRVPGVAVLFDPEPSWARAAVQAAFDLPCVPTATRIDRKGRKSVPTAEELHALAAAMAAAVALVDSAAPSAAREVTVGGVTVGAHLERPAPAPARAAAAAEARGSGRRKDRAAAKVHQLKVSLQGIDPPVWRRLLVPSAFTVGDLHLVLRIAFGWPGASMHEFTAGRGVRYADGDLTEWGQPAIPEDSISLAEALPRAGRKLTYVVQAEDEWRHEVRVEKIVALEPPQQDAVCLAGARAPPIDGCGGAWRYGEFLAVLADPAHEEHGWHSDWAGADFDPEAFSAEVLSEELRALRPRVA